jgi:predicted Zn-ribbon and HTH transcriptional regulator
MGSSQSALITKFTSNRAIDVAEGMKLLKKHTATPAVFADPRFFKAVLPPLATILGTGYTHTDAKLAALRDLSFLVVRPPGVSPEAVNLCLGNLVETILISPIILSMFSPDSEVRTAATEAVSGLAPSGGLFGASEFAHVLVEYLKNVSDEVAKVRLLPSLWMAGTHLSTVLKPTYATVLHILLNSERSGHLRAQIIAEFRRILHEEPTVLDGPTSTLLFHALRQIISNHNPAEVDVVVDFSYGCLLKLIPQRRSVLGTALLKSVTDICAATLSQPLVAPQYLDINCCVTAIVIESCDESVSTAITNICICAARHFTFHLNSRTLEDIAIGRLSGSVLNCFASVLSWHGLPSFPLWTPKFYKSVSTVTLVALLCANEAVASQGATLLSRAANASSSYLQFFIGDFSLAFLIHVARLLHPSNMKSGDGLNGPNALKEFQLPCEDILEELFSQPTTAERQHRVIKDELIPQLTFLTDYPVSVISPPVPGDDTSFGQLQNELWTALNVVRAALCHILLCLIRVRGRTQPQLVELFSIWYDRMSFSGHFILVDVLNKALMSLLVKADGAPLALAANVYTGVSPTSQATQSAQQLGMSGNQSQSMRLSATLVQPSAAASSASSLSSLGSLPPSASGPSNSILAAPSPVHPSLSSPSLLHKTAMATNTMSATSSLLGAPPSTGAPSLPSSVISPIPSFPPAPGSPTPHTISLATESDRTEMQKKLHETEQELKAVLVERSQLAFKLSERDKEFTEVMTEKEQLLSQLACAVCLENILANKPVCLECGHMFCGSCADSFMKKQAKCPLCKAEIKKIVQVKGLEG